MVKDLQYIDNLQTLHVIGHPTRQAILELLYEPHSVTDLAAHLGVPRTRLYHHINLLVEHQIIDVVATRQVGAITEKIYEATAKEFRPGPGLLASGTPEERTEAILATVIDSTRADLGRALTTGVIDLDTPETAAAMRLSRWLGRVPPQKISDLLEAIDGVAAQLVDSDEGEPYALTIALYPTSRKLP